MDFRFLLVAACLFLSGFAGLLYETAWTRQFSIVFGSSELAVVAVLAAYFAGLTAGAAVGGRFAARVRRPLLTYGVMEAGIGLSALAVPWAIRGLMSLYVDWFGVAAGEAPAEGAGRLVFQLVAAFLILAVPTGLMGATLPLLARQSVRSDEELGRRVGWLYAVNTFGAVAGTLSVAFYLLPTIGLRSTLYVGVAVNGLVFVLASLLGSNAPVATAKVDSATAPPARGRWVLPLMLMSGAVAFGYEVLWTRLLVHLLGGSTFAFATMLASFLIGIAAGSALGTRAARDYYRAARGLGWAQLGAGVMSVAAFRALDLLPEVDARLRSGTSGVFADAAIALMIILPSAVCIGATFPLAVRILARDDSQAGGATGRVYAWNTVGAVIGAVGGGVWLLPWLAYGKTLTLLAAMNLLLGGLLAALSRPARTLAAMVGIAAVALTAARPGEPWGLLRASALKDQRAEGAITYYAVGRSATVLLTDDVYAWQLRTNGLREACIWRPDTGPWSVETPRWLGCLPGLIRPNAKSMMVVGLGGAATLETLPTGLTRIEVIELEPEVVAANRKIGSLRPHDPLADPRIRIQINDARGALLLSPTRYDSIVSQPSHPWTSGASHLYTREFFDLARSRLEPGGVFIQWMGPAFLDESLLRGLVAGLTAAFPHVNVYWTQNEDLLFAASDQELPQWDRPEDFVPWDAPSLARLGIASREDLALSLMLDDAGARELAAQAVANTDDFNRLESGSPRALRGAGLPAEQLQGLFAPFDPLLKSAPSLDRVHLVRRLLAHSSRARAATLVAAMPDSPERRICQSWIYFFAGEYAKARAELDAAIGDDPDVKGADSLKLVFLHPGIRAHLPAAAAVMLPRGDPGQAVIEGWELEAAGSWEGLRALEPRLAATPANAVEFTEATRLRATWRVRSRQPDLAREAAALLECPAILFWRSVDVLLRLEAQGVAGGRSGARKSLMALQSCLPATPAAQATAEQATARIASLNLPGAG